MGLRLFFFLNLPGATFITDSRVVLSDLVNVKIVRTIEHIFVAFSEKLNFNASKDCFFLVNVLYEKYSISLEWPHLNSLA